MAQLKALETQNTASQHENKATVKLNREQERLNDAAEVFKTYQDNIRTVGQIRTEIYKGIAEGENTTILLLKACKAISLMTGDQIFAEEVERNIIAIRGEGMLEPEALEVQLDGVKKRLKNLKKAAERETNDRELRRIKGAEKAHEKKKRELESLIERQKKHMKV